MATESKPFRVHLVCNDISLKMGGAQRLVRDLHDGLSSRGIESTSVVVWGEKTASTVSLGKKNPYSFGAILSLRAYLRSECGDNDIVHVHLFPALLFVVIAAHLAQFKGTLVATEHNTTNRRRGTLWGKAMDWFIYSKYRHIVCISQATKKSLSQWQPRFSSRLKVINNGVSLEESKFRPREFKNEPTILSVGRLSKQKNYENALRAVSLLGSAKFHYQIAGTGILERDLKALRDELNMKASVQFCGFVTQIHDLLRNADIFLMPSRWEGFGLAAVEAMNAGLPVVASDVPGLAEIVGNSGDVGFLVDPEKPVEISSALNSLLIDHKLRLRMGECAFRRSRDFSVETMVTKHAHFYRSIA